MLYLQVGVPTEHTNHKIWPMAWKSNRHFVCKVLKDPDDFAKLSENGECAIVFGKIGGVLREVKDAKT